MRNSAVIIQDGIRCLLKHLGAYETEVFVWNLIKEPFDYTKWQQEHFKDMSMDEFNARAVQFDKQHPFVVSQKNDK